jgi:hypothetical protein
VVFGSNFLSVLLAVGISSPAAAVGPIAVNIEYTAPAACSSLDSFYRGVRARTDRVRLASSGETGVQIRVRVFRVGHTIRGELTIGEHQAEDETRRVDGVSCNEVVEALSLTAALAIDPSVSLLSKRDAADNDGLGGVTQTNIANTGSPAIAPGPPSLQGNGASSGPSSNSDAPLAQSNHLDLSTQAVASSYVTHGLMLGPQVGLRLLVPVRPTTWVSAGVQVFHVSNDWFGTAVSGRFKITGVGLTLCPLQRAFGDWFEVGACASARGGLLKASGLGMSHPQSVERSWWTLGLDALATLRLYGPWSLEFSAGMAAPLVLREFTVGTPGQDVGKTPVLAAQAGLGMAYRF